VALASANPTPQPCSCESSGKEFTDLIFNCPIDTFCSGSLVAGSCGKVCPTSGSFHSSPNEPWDSSIVIGTHTCVGSNFDVDNGGSVLCTYSTPSRVLSTSNTCNFPAFNCSGCDSTQLRYFDDDADYNQINCESGLVQFEYSDNTSDEGYSTNIQKSTCAVTPNAASYDKIVTAISCKTRAYEVDGCLQSVGSPAGLTGHCKFGLCWLYCADNTKQLSFIQAEDGVGPRVDADFLGCEASFAMYGQYSAFHAECN
ncbi:hypothetical protein PENTCL1PPCAC_21700, partial [Pristionchus entomophagus]